MLDGIDFFPILAIALAPFTIGAALLTTSQNPLWAALGRVNLIAITTILAPSNPQSCNPQDFLFISFFLVRFPRTARRLAEAAREEIRKPSPAPARGQLGGADGVDPGRAESRQEDEPRARWGTTQFLSVFPTPLQKAELPWAPAPPAPFR
ncbi:hypothetical protein AC630_07125 [Bradyrhizobium sp. AS23.2]|nr:hypothetical protein AC630_07125 [Bradyrhizobium sp. AS23.2]